MNWILLILTLTTVGARAETLDFRQALARALEKSPDYNSLTLRLKNAELTQKNAWASLLPTLDFQAGTTYADQNSTTYINSPFRHAPWSNQAGFSINENLYDNGVTWRQGQIADLNLKLQSLSLQSGRDRLLVNVAKAFYDYSLAVGVLELQKQQTETLKYQFRTIEGRYRQGMNSNRDFLRIKAQVQSAEIGLINQTLQIQLARQNLRLAIGDSQASEFKAMDPDKTLLTEPLNPVQTQNTYEYQMVETQNKISEITYESAHRLEWPRLSLKGSYNSTSPQYFGQRIAGVDEPYWNLQFMILLDYRMWDWGISQRSVQLAENQKRIEFNGQAVNTLKVNEDLVQLEAQIQLLKKSSLVSQQILKANQEAFDSLSRGYRDGKISYLDLITALDALYSSRSQDLTLRFNFLKSRMDWAYYEGKVDEALKKQ